MALEFIDKAPTLEEYKEMRRLVNFMPLSDRMMSAASSLAFARSILQRSGTTESASE